MGIWSFSLTTVSIMNKIFLELIYKLSLINNQTERIVWETGQLGSIADADSGTYLSQCALAICGVFGENI